MGSQSLRGNSSPEHNTVSRTGAQTQTARTGTARGHHMRPSQTQMKQYQLKLKKKKKTTLPNVVLTEIMSLFFPTPVKV